MARPVIALLTDFGTSDHYVGAMKGVMLGICPDAVLVDITHDIAPHDVLGGAVELEACFKVFPAGTVFLAVVDPGVGTARRAIAAAHLEYRFVAPDNGVLTPVLDGQPPPVVVELSDRRYAREEISRTFEGRDRFAPAAAWLAAGIEVTALGARVEDPVTISIPVPVVEDGSLIGEVLCIDRFGNAVTNIDQGSWRRAASAGLPRVQVGSWRTTRVVGTYAELGMGEAGVMFGSRGTLEVSAREARAADLLAIRRGDHVMVRWQAEGRGADGL